MASDFDNIFGTKPKSDFDAVFASGTAIAEPPTITPQPTARPFGGGDVQLEAGPEQGIISRTIEKFGFDPFPKIKSTNPNDFGPFERLIFITPQIGKAAITTLASLFSGVALNIPDIAANQFDKRVLKTKEPATTTAELLTRFLGEAEDVNIAEAAEKTAKFFNFAGRLASIAKIIGPVAGVGGTIAKGVLEVGGAATVDEISKAITDSPEFRGTPAVIEGFIVGAIFSIASLGVKKVFTSLSGAEKSAALKRLGLKKGATENEIRKAAQKKIFKEFDPERKPELIEQFKQVVRDRDAAIAAFRAKGKPTPDIITRTTRRGRALPGKVTETPPTTVAEIFKPQAPVKAVIPTTAITPPVVTPQVTEGLEAKPEAVEGEVDKITKPDKISAMVDDTFSIKEGKAKGVVFHGTKTDFSEFDFDKAGTVTDTGSFGEGVYFTPDVEIAKAFSGDKGFIKTAKVELENPFVVNFEKNPETLGEVALWDTLTSKEITKRLKAKGHDGVVVFDAVTGENITDIVVFSSKSISKLSTLAQPTPTAKPKPVVAKKPITKKVTEKEVVVTKPSETTTKIPQTPKEPITEQEPTIELKAKEAQIFNEAVRTQEEITATEAGEVGLEPVSIPFSEHIDTFQSYQLPQTSKIPRITRQMKTVNGLRLAGKITPAVANKRIHKLRQLAIKQALKEKIALRVSKKGKVKIALRESGVFVPEEVATYKKYKDIEPILGGGQDITRAIQQMDGALPIKEKLQTKGQAGPIERFVLWRTRKMTIQKLNWLKEKTLEVKGILSAKKGSIKDKEINLILEKIGVADRDVPLKDILSKKEFASFSKESIKAAQELRQFYDDLIEEQNAARAMRGQDEIPYRQNYSPHILRDVTVWEQLFLRDKTAKILEKKDLPDYIKPNAPFNPRAQAREADIPYDKRVLSARELAESYIITASKDIFNTSIVQNNKAFIDQLRGQGLEKTADYLAEWTATSYAGIKPRLDRAIKLPKWAAGSLRYFNRLRNMAVFPLNVAWSLSTQPLSLSNTIGRYGLPNTVRGFFQWLKPSIRKQAAQDYFSFIVKTSKRGGVTKQDASNLLGANIKIKKSVGEFVEDWSTVLLTEMEKLLTGTSIRAAHITGAKRGLKGEALKNFASDGGGKTQSMYNDEDKPMILRSLLVKSAAPYQTYAFEVANTFREWAGKTGTPPDSKLYAMWSVTRWLASLTVLKMIANTVRGKEWSWWDLVPIPFREFWLSPVIQKLTGEFVPGSAGLPSPVDAAARIAKGMNDVLETGNWRKLRNEMLKWGPGVFGIPGGVQWSRMVDAIIVYSSGGLTDRRGRVMFEMEDPDDLARAMFTGVWSTKEGRKKLDPKKKDKDEFTFTGEKE